MAKPIKPPFRPVPQSTAPQALSQTEVRNSPVPRPATPGNKQITAEMIARRAYEIWQSGKGGSDFDNWVRAERELRSGQTTSSAQRPTFR